MPRIQTTKVYYELDNAVKSGYTTVSEQGSSRSGKTRNTVIWLCAYLMRHPGLRLSVVRKTLTALRGSVLYDFKDVLIKMGLWEWRQKAFNKSEFTFTFPDGSWIEFFSTDDEQKLRGRKRDICYVNEANELSALEWQQLKMRTTMFTIADYNPSFSDEHWLCEVNADPRTYHFITTYKDNPFLEQTIIDEIEGLQYKNKTLWQVYGLGMQAVIEGLIFTNVEVIDEIPEYAKKKHWRGLDFGYNPDPTAIEDVYFYNNTLYIDEICYQTEMLTSDIIRVLKEHDGSVEIISESADPRLIQEIYRGGCNIKPVVKYPGSILAGITKMLEYKICITKRSYNIIKEFKNYTWAQDKEGKWLKEPAAGSGDHCFVADTKVVTSKGEKRIADVVKGDFVLTSDGYRQVLDNHDNGVKKVFTFRLTFDNFITEVRCTPDHRIKTTKGWKQIQDLKPGDILYALNEELFKNQPSSLTERCLDYTMENVITQRGGENYMLLFGNFIMAQSRKVAKFITRILTASITTSRISNALQKPSIMQSITKKLQNEAIHQSNSNILNEYAIKQVNGTEARKEGNGILNTGSGLHCSSNPNALFANTAEQNFGRRKRTQNIVQTLARQEQGANLGLMTRSESVNGVEKNLQLINIPERNTVREVALCNIRVVSKNGDEERVYDLTVDGIHEYIANGIVVHNCIDGIRYVVLMKILGGRPKPVNMTQLANIAY